MLADLRVPLSAQFYAVVQPITREHLLRLFADLRNAALNASPAAIRAVRTAVHGSRCSAISFAYDRPVPFLADASRTERVYGFVMLVESDGHLVLFRSGLELPAAFKRKHLAVVDRIRLERAIAREDATFERLSLRNMTIAPLALKSKTLEGGDVETAVAALSASRFVPQSYRVRRSDGSYAATPSTGRIGMRGSKVDHVQAVAWTETVLALLADDAAATSPFIRTFARPQDFRAMSAGLVPTRLSFDALTLANEVCEPDRTMRLVREVGGAWTELGGPAVASLLAALQEPLEVGGTGSDRVLSNAAGADVGRLRIGARRMSLVSLRLPAVLDVWIEDAAIAIGTNPGRTRLDEYLDAEDMLVVLFADATLAYIDGALFRDEALTGGGDLFLRRLRTEPALAGARSEKGRFTATQRSFRADSVFRRVVDAVAAVDDILVCDDLGDEWADFIGLNTAADPPTITFYHAKHGRRSLGASAFHDAVGQAIKNLGRLAMTGERMTRKFASWNDAYRKDHVTTAIARVVRGGPVATLPARVERVATGPDTTRRVFIVTSSLSRTDVADAFARLQAGGSVQPSFVQLYWLLNGFFSACAEVGAVGYVVCRD